MHGKLIRGLLLGIFTLTMAQAADAQTRTGARHARQGGAGENRVALIIGNSNYRMSPLRNPVNDARALATAARRVGFDVTVKLDASRIEMRRAIIKFGRRLEEGGVGLFYYAGHGVQINGANYLIPVSAEINAEDHVEIESIDLNQVLGRMGGARNRLNIVILDACRNNPFARSFRSASRGLAQTLAPAGTYIAYATAPGDVAEDGEGRNSLYTASLAKWMAEPGMRLEDVFKRVRGSIYDRTGGRQVPWTSSSITGDFYFVPRREAVTASAPSAAPAPSPRVPDRRLFELSYWDSIKNSSNPADFEAYLRQFPNGVFADLARNRIGAAAAPAAAPAPSRRRQRVPEQEEQETALLAAPPTDIPPGVLGHTVTEQDKRNRKRVTVVARRSPRKPVRRTRSFAYNGVWTATDGDWSAELRIDKTRVRGRLKCAREETPSADGGALTGATDEAVPAKIDSPLRGKINTRGQVRIYTSDQAVNYRELGGIFPNLKLWSAGECGGAKFVFKKQDGDTKR